MNYWRGTFKFVHQYQDWLVDLTFRLKKKQKKLKKSYWKETLKFVHQYQGWLVDLTFL